MKYDFKTRQLYPFSNKWENGMQGELWYIWEDDAICIVNGDSKYPIAKGVAAAMIAQKHVLFSFFDQTPMIYKAYNQELIKSNFPNICIDCNESNKFDENRYDIPMVQGVADGIYDLFTRRNNG